MLDYGQVVHMTGASLDTLYVWEYVCVWTHVYLHTRSHTYTFTRTVKSASGVFILNRMSGEDVAALTSVSLPINTRLSIMSTPVPDPWQVLSKAGRCGINPEMTHTLLKLIRYCKDGAIQVVYNSLWMPARVNSIWHLTEKNTLYNYQLRKHVFLTWYNL